MDATGVRFMAGHLESVNDHEEISGNQLWNLREFARYDLQVLMELGFSEFLKSNRKETISVNWESGQVNGNKDTIKNAVETFENGIYPGIITVSKKPWIQRLYFDTQGHINYAVFGYIEKQLVFKKILPNNYFFQGKADRTNQDILRVEVFCKTKNDLTVTKEVLNDTFCSFHLKEFSDDVKTEIENWKRKGKLVEVDENDGVTLTCTSDVKQIILQIHEQIIKRTCIISSLHLKYLVKHRHLLEGISNRFDVRIEIAPDKYSLELEGRYEQIKVAEREIRLQQVTESVSLENQQLSEQLQFCLDTIAKEHGCEWEWIKDNIHQTERKLQNCEYIATWYSSGRPGTFTVIEGETHDLNVDCLILLSTDTLFPVQIKPDESMLRAMIAEMQSRGQHCDIGDCIFLQDPAQLSRCYKACCHLVIANSNPSELDRNKSFHGISLKFKELFNKVISMEWKTVCMPAWIEKKFLSMDNIVKGYLEAVIDFQERGTALQFYLYCEKEKCVLREPLLTCIQKCYKKKNGFSRKIYRQRDFNSTILKTRQEPKIEVKIDSIENMKTDIIVNTTSKDLNLSMGAISKRLLSLADEEMLKECQNKYPNGIKHGEIAVTGTYELGRKNKCTSFIFHGALPRFKREKYVQNIKGFVRCCLSEADRRKCESIAFPALGTGSLGYPGREVAKAMFDAVEDYRQEAINPCVKRVVFSLYVKDNDVCEVFMREEQKRQAMASVKQKKWTLPHFQEVQESVGFLKGTLTRETDVVEIIVGMTSDIDPLGTNVVEIVINPFQDGDIQWEYSDKNPQTNNDRLIVSYRESEPTMSKKMFGNSGENRFKGAVNSAISNCVDNNIAEIAFYFESGLGSGVANHKKITIIADVIDSCLTKQTNGGSQTVLHKVYIRLVDVLLFENVRDKLLKPKWTLNPVVQFGVDLKWELMDPAVKARIEIVGESVETVHKVKQNIELELFRAAEIDRNNGSFDPTQPDFDVDSQFYTTNYNRDLGARPITTEQNMTSNETSARDADLGMRNKNSRVEARMQVKHNLEQVFRREEQKRQAIASVKNENWTLLHFQEVQEKYRPSATQKHVQIREQVDGNPKEAACQVENGKMDIVNKVTQEVSQDESVKRIPMKDTYNGTRPKYKPYPSRDNTDNDNTTTETTTTTHNNSSNNNNNNRTTNYEPDHKCFKNDDSKSRQKGENTCVGVGSEKNTAEIFEKHKDIGGTREKECSQICKVSISEASSKRINEKVDAVDGQLNRNSDIGNDFFGSLKDNYDGMEDEKTQDGEPLVGVSAQINPKIIQMKREEKTLESWIRKLSMEFDLEIRKRGLRYFIHGNWTELVNFTEYLKNHSHQEPSKLLWSAMADPERFGVDEIEDDRLKSENSIVSFIIEENEGRVLVHLYSVQDFDGLSEWDINDDLLRATCKLQDKDKTKDAIRKKLLSIVRKECNFEEDIDAFMAAKREINDLNEHNKLQAYLEVIEEHYKIIIYGKNEQAVTNAEKILYSKLGERHSDFPTSLTSIGSSTIYSEQRKKVFRELSKTGMDNKIKLYIGNESLTTLAVDSIVCHQNRLFSLKHGLTQQVYELLGTDGQKLIDSEVGKLHTENLVYEVPVDGGNLSCKYLQFVVLPDRRINRLNFEDAIINSVIVALEYADVKGYKTVAFPLLGREGFHCSSVEACTSALVRGIFKYVNEGTWSNIRGIHLIDDRADVIDLLKHKVREMAN